MKKTVFITGSTDGIGLETAKTLVLKGHRVLIHGRNQSKLEKAVTQLTNLTGEGRIESYLADLSRIADIKALADEVIGQHAKLDVLINNAGVYKTSQPITQDGLDVRFVVNTLAPYLLTEKLLPLLHSSARVISLSSAAQAPVNLDALSGKVKLSDDLKSYSQSKLALTMWSRTMARIHKDKGPVFIAVNPGSLLATKMVKEGFGVAGNDIHIGSDILTRLALDEEFASATGKYFDNDVGKFASPHSDALDEQKCDAVIDTIKVILTEKV